MSASQVIEGSYIDDLKYYASTPQFCSTSLGNVPLTSNGGVSHCND